MTESGETWNRTGSWIGKGIWAVVDQALFGGANFLVSVMLARWLSPEDYGAFSVAFSILLLLGALHTSILTEPMTIFGAGESNGDLPSYAGFLLRIHVVLTASLSIPIYIASKVLEARSPALASALVGLALAAPFILLPWLSRRVFYAQFAPRAAASGSVVFLLVSVGGVSALFAAGILSAASALLVTGFAGLAAGGPLFVYVRPALGTPVDKRAIIARHWSFGSRNTVANGVYWVSAQLPQLLAPVFLGLGVTGAIAAVLNLFRPLSLVMQASTSLALPAFSRSVNDDPAAVLRRKAATVIAFYLLVSLAYGTAVSLFSRWILHAAYGGTYDGYEFLIVLVSIASVVSAFVQGVTTLLKAAGDFESIVSIWFLSAIVVSVSMIPAMLIWDANGAIGATVLGYLVAAVAARRVLAARLGRPAEAVEASSRPQDALDRGETPHR